MKILHMADLHFCRDRADEALASMQAALEAAIRHEVDLIAIAGDTWDGPLQNTAGSRFPEFITAISELAERAPVAMIYGTPTHDVDGSLEVFTELKTTCGITILKPGIAYGLQNGAIDAFSTSSEVLLFGIPEPNKKWLLADESAGAIGKDTADEAVRASMRNLFLGLGGLRKQTPHIPCIALYHGQVVGAKTSTGYSADSAIAVTMDDLVALGADYIACGDIHLPQQIGSLAAYYSGSIYPGNFGETHQVGCNLVVMEPWRTSVERIDFPHPRRMKVSLRAGDKLSMPVAGAIVWQEITCTREESVKIDTVQLGKYLIAAGALEGSRVTLNILPTETVRAGDIVARKTLRAKIEIWGENSSLKLSETVYKKADQLESEAISSGRATAGARIRIDKLILKGAIGLWEVSRKDEVVLDLEPLGSGVIALAGGNGTGKTTLLENLHPYPQMLTRSGALKSHFRLRDSCRDLYFTDLANGVRYRALIQINGATASGTAEYFLFKDTGSGFEPVPGVVGRLEAYEAEILRLFGPLSLYLKTAFVTQRPSKDSPDLADATKGDRKTLFADLAGIDYLSVYAQDAKGRADTLDRSVQDRSILLKTMETLNFRLECAISNLNASTEQKTRLAAAMAEVTKEGTQARSKLEALKILIANYKDLVFKRASTTESINRAISDRAVIKQRREYYLTRLRSVPLDNEQKIAEGEAITDRIKALEQQLAELNFTFNHAMRDYRDQHATYQKQLSEIQKSISGNLQLKAAREASRAALADRLAKPIKDTCPTCGQTLPPDALAQVQSERAGVSQRLDAISIQLREIDGQIKIEEERQRQLVAPIPPESPVFQGESELSSLKVRYKELDILTAQKIREATREASTMIGSIDAQIKDSDARIAELETTLLSIDELIARQFPVNPESEYADVSNRYDVLRNEHSRISGQLGGVSATIDALNLEISDIESKLAERETLLALQESESKELSDWRTLEQACGKDGIQALELDALSPSISQIANELLATAYGDRYRIEFRTTRIAGKGSKTKQVEDFLIYIINQETGTEKELAFLSGGEAVWIKRAIYDAFSTIRARTSGQEFLTIFQDEADGALDPSARMSYLRMLEAAHAASGRYQTILISHSTEIQSMVERVITIADLAGRNV